MKRFLKILGSILLVLLLILLAWGLIEPYRLDQEHFRVPMPGLPAAWDGTTVAVVGDFQVGMWLDNQGTVEEAVQAIIDQDPDVALLLGDFVYHFVPTEGQEIDQAIALAAPLVDAGIPTYAVLGNHDYGLNSPDDAIRERLAERVAATLEADGIPVLINEALPLDTPAGGPPLYIVGTGSRYAGNDFPQQALAGVPAAAPRLLLMHNPDSFPEVPPQSAPLALAGHTHGGQIRVPGFPQWSLLALFQQDAVHSDGWIEADYGAAGNRLYVNRGIGMSIVPLRLFTPPEVTFFELEQADGLGEPVELP